MDTLSLQEPSLAKKLAAQLIRFEDLSKWSSLSIRTLLKHTPRSVVVTALVDAPDDILRKIQGNIPEQIWLLLNQDIATQKSQTQTDQVAQARSKIVDIARTLLQQSKIDV